MATLLDRPTNDTTAQYPPRVIELMKQMGIYHPGLTYPLTSRQGAHEAAIMSDILQQSQREADTATTEEYRKNVREENLAQRQLSQEQLNEYRQGRLAQTSEGQDVRKAQTLQLMLNDPSLKEIYGSNYPAFRRQVADEIARGTGLTPPTAAAPGATKGEYGPGGAPAGVPTPTAPPTVNPADVYSGTPAATAQGGGGTPEAPRPIGRYFQPERYAGSGLNPSQLARAAANLDRTQAADDYFNMLAYKRDIGAPKFESIYGTSEPSLIKPGMPPAAEIPAIYGGKPTIPTVSRVGYYDAKGNFLAPLYTETGEKLPMPKGATGIRGTADLPVTEGQGGLTNVPSYLKDIVAGKALGGQANVPTAETAMVPTQAPNAYRPAEGTFTPPTGVAAAPLLSPTSPDYVSPEQAAANRAATLGFLGKFLNLPKTPEQQAAEAAQRQKQVVTQY